MDEDSTNRIGMSAEDPITELRRIMVDEGLVKIIKR